MTWFTSDNSGPAAPEIIAALTDANHGYASGYGADPIMEQVTAQIREVFEAPQAAVYLVGTGTAANALSLATLVNPWDAVYCSEFAHVEWDECGAPEFFTGGAKLVLIAGENGKIAPDLLAARLAEGTQSDVHQVQRGALSITNTTELGAVYTPAEVRALTDLAGDYNMPCHMDGARFANAIAANGCSPAEMTWKAGIDILSFGGTKNGLLGVEAVILFDPKHAREFELRRKRAGHLFSKHRYFSAQMQAYLKDGLWLSLARQANEKAAMLAQGLRDAGVNLVYGSDANILFISLPRNAHRRLQELGFHYYLWPHTASLEGDGDAILNARLVTNWASTDGDVDGFIQALRGANQ